MSGSNSTQETQPSSSLPGWARLRAFAIPTLLVAGSLLVLDILVSALGDPGAGGQRRLAAAGPESVSCEDDVIERLPMRWTSAPSLIASGTDNGQSWSLCSRTAERTDNVDPATPKETVCFDWLYGDGPGSGMDCWFLTEPLSRESLQVTGASGDRAFYGLVPGDTATVEARMSDGDVNSAKSYTFPDSWALPVKAFVLLTEDVDAYALVMKDESGNVITQWDVPSPSN